jgi:NAD(P)-dependent dehydrogenase (short-subunit alcohol dehydrogenase family)
VNDDGLEGTRVMVTGGASGIGASVARRLIEAKATVILVDLDAERLSSLVEDLGDRACARVCDVTDEEAFQETFDSLHREGPVQGLVCCAGMPDIPTKAEQLSLKHFSRVLDSHLVGTVNCCRVVGSRMLESGGGSIVNVASVLSYNSGPVLGYGAAKAGVVNVTASLATQWASRGVRVNAVAPGWTDTPFLRPKEREGKRDLEPILAACPLHRLLRPEEVAEVIAFLLSPKSSAIVGTTVACDGGVIAAAGWPPYGGVPN